MFILLLLLFSTPSPASPLFEELIDSGSSYSTSKIKLIRKRRLREECRSQNLLSKIGCFRLKPSDELYSLISKRISKETDENLLKLIKKDLLPEEVAFQESVTRRLDDITYVNSSP